MEHNLGVERMSNDKSVGAMRAQQILNTFGCLPSINPLTALPAFDALELAGAIEQNLQEAGMYGHTKITIHLDLPDAYALAQALRRN